MQKLELETNWRNLGTAQERQKLGRIILFKTWYGDSNFFFNP